MDGEDLGAELLQQFAAWPGIQCGDSGVQGGEVVAELTEMVDLQRQVDLAQGDGGLRYVGGQGARPRAGVVAGLPRTVAVWGGATGIALGVGMPRSTRTPGPWV
ncbi:hypothetical protein ACFO9E_34870 [Streptomyces maoxianensis]|uniref:Uncharacterized protein n=1 Tax=Streptomyces maoxianensis TaxID=1459942 RepID=A0ABV9GIE5_9ACTN